MTSPHRPPRKEENEPDASPTSRLKPLRVTGHILAYAVAGIILGGIGLLLITILPGSPWLFLLYPVLIALVLVSLIAIVLHLLHRFA